jgi:pilus assembly protein CpaB
MRFKALLAALGTAALGVALMFVYMRRFEDEVRGGAPVPVLIATQDIPLGAQISEDMLGIAQLPRTFVQERNIGHSDVQRILGVRTRLHIRANEWILWSDLATSSDQQRDLSSLIREGMRAVNVGASSSSTFGGLLRPGDRVDVLLTMEEPQSVTVPLLQNALVLAVGADTGRPQVTAEGEEIEVSQITLALTVEQAQLITLASTRGRMSLTLRNPDDINVIENLPESGPVVFFVAERRIQVQKRGFGRPRPPQPTGPTPLE